MKFKGHYLFYLLGLNSFRIENDCAKMKIEKQISKQ